MLKSLLHKNYLIYGGSIIFSRGLEYVVLFFAAYHLTKSDYGELEFYKKIIEIGSSVFAFGFPALLVSYTRSNDSKDYLFLLSFFFVLILSGVLALVFSFSPWLFLIVPFGFYALYFTGGITQSYILVKDGSNQASLYKIAISIVFYSLVFASIYFYSEGKMAFVYVNYVLLPIALIYTYVKLKKLELALRKLKHYWNLLKKLLLSSFTLVISNFANLMFLYTDIFIIKLLSKNANIDIANYSFALNIASMLLLVPMTLVQVDIEKLKKDPHYVAILNKKIVVIVCLSMCLLIILFAVLTNFLISEYKNVFILFLIILLAKAIQSFSPLYGAMLIINKQFNGNLIINSSTLLINVLVSYIMFNVFGIIGIAIAGVISLGIRQLILYNYYFKLLKRK